MRGLDAWITGNYGDDNDGPLRRCDRCGEWYDPARIEEREHLGGGSYVGCTCVCEVSGEWVRFCDCDACVNRRAAMTDV